MFLNLCYNNNAKIMLYYHAFLTIWLQISLLCVKNNLHCIIWQNMENINLNYINFTDK